MMSYAPSHDYQHLQMQLKDVRCHDIVFRMLTDADKNNPQAKLGDYIDEQVQVVYFRRIQYLYDYFSALENQQISPEFHKIQAPTTDERYKFLKNTCEVIRRSAATDTRIYEAMSNKDSYMDMRAAYIRRLTDTYHTPFAYAHFCNGEKRPLEKHQRRIVYPLNTMRNREKNRITRQP